MRTVIQRVKSAQVAVENKVIGEIGPGLLVFLGVSRDDDLQDVFYLIEKTLHLRVFEDQDGKMNRSLLEVGGEMLVASQFTLYADCRKGRRPSFAAAAEPGEAKALYDEFIKQAQNRGVRVATGEFQALMEVSLVNDGPVTILLDSKRIF